MATTMSNPGLPADLLDQIVDLVHEETDTLNVCSLVSKSWTPHTRKHLFANVKFPTMADLQSWKELFPDPSTSPACYTRSLLIRGCPLVIAAAGAGEGGWIPAFSRIVHLEVVIPRESINGPETLFLSFLILSPTLKSLRVTFGTVPNLPLSNFIGLFPYLQNLAVTTPCSMDDRDYFGEHPLTIQPFSPVVFIGTLDLSLGEEINPVAEFQLLPLSNGLHFRELRLRWDREEDTVLAKALIERCSSTLETLSLQVNPERFSMVTYRTVTHSSLVFAPMTNLCW